MLPQLVLWDIDGTLVQQKKSARNNHMKIVTEFHDCPIVFEPLPGMTDYEIIEKILTINSIKFSRNDVAFLLKSLDKEFLKSKVVSSLLPGILNCLKLINANHGINGIQTGNTKTRALRKLEAAQIGNFFHPKYLFTGDASASRLALIDSTNPIFDEFENLLIIGDTEFDLALANSLDIESLGLATGDSSLRELQQMGFSHAFEDGNELYSHLEKRLRTFR